MGSLTYDGLTVNIDDRTLAHLQVVIVQKLRRNESFLMSWKDSDDVGNGRSAIWLHPAIPLRFKYSGGRAPVLNRDWIDKLVTSANSPQGLVVSDDSGVPSPQGKETDRKPLPTILDPRG